MTPAPPCRRPPGALRHRLFARIYAALVLGALLASVVGGALSVLAWDPTPPPAVQGGLEALVEALPPPGDPRHPDAVRALAARLDGDLTLRDPNGQVVASSGEVLPDGPPGWWWDRGAAGVRARLDDGGSVTLNTRGPPRRHPRFALGLVGVALAFAAAAWPVSRRLAGRLERLRDGVAAWGPDDLSRRVPLDGHDEVADVAAAFNAAAGRVEQLVVAERRMLASASHELRSPLARIRMALSLLEDDDPQRSAWVAAAERDVDELDATVGDLLQVGRVQALGVERPEPVHLRALLIEALGEGAVDGPDTVVPGDPRLLRRLVRNLVDNARKHGAGDVSAWTTPDGLCVADRGPGVPEALRARIFEPFFRPDGHAEGRDGGVGLGLWLVAEIARAHGGAARVEDRPGGGAVFGVRLHVA